MVFYYHNFRINQVPLPRVLRIERPMPNKQDLVIQFKYVFLTNLIAQVVRQDPNEVERLRKEVLTGTVTDPNLVIINEKELARLAL